jgi:hypothetical protein
VKVRSIEYLIDAHLPLQRCVVDDEQISRRRGRSVLEAHLGMSRDREGVRFRERQAAAVDRGASVALNDVQDRGRRALCEAQIFAGSQLKSREAQRR